MIGMCDTLKHLCTELFIELFTLGKDVMLDRVKQMRC